MHISPENYTLSNNKYKPDQLLNLLSKSYPKMLLCTTNSLTKSQVELEAIQTVTALNVTNPRSTTFVEAKGLASTSFFERRVHTVLYYNKMSDEDSGYFLAGWSKDSLMKAIEEEPMLAGRVRRRGEKGEGFQIVSDDVGVRLVEAKISKTVLEFVSLMEKDKLEGELVTWEDVGADGNPYFCPLFHIQVTNFLCGGYSIGISCSLLVGDPFSIVSFLKRWANIHQKVVYENNRALPLFYLPNFKQQNSTFAKLISSNTFKNRGATLVLKTFMLEILEDGEMNKALAQQSLEEAELKYCVKRTSSFYLVVKELNGDVKSEKVEREWLVKKPLLELISVNWDDLGASEVAFSKGNNPVCVCNWINSIPGETLVVLFPVSNGKISGINILVTLPEKTGV